MVFRSAAAVACRLCPSAVLAAELLACAAPSRGPGQPADCDRMALSVVMPQRAEHFDMPLGELVDYVPRGVAMLKAERYVSVGVTHEATGRVFSTAAGFRRYDLFVASQVAANACLRARVLTHERRHIDVYDQFLEEMPKLAQASFMKHCADLAKLDDSSAQKAWNQDFWNDVFPVVDQRQAMWDDADPLGRTTLVCGDRILQTLRDNKF
jgi:hypothetical protein